MATTILEQDAAAEPQSDSQGEPQIVHAFAKNTREEVLAAVTEYRGARYVDLRIYVRTGDGPARPTRKGLTLRPELLPELEAAVRCLRDAVADRPTTTS